MEYLENVSEREVSRVFIPQEIPDKNCRKALVLSGGGARGSFQFAALQSLRSHANFDPDDRYHNLFDEFDLIAGVSVGALNAVMIAMGKEATLKDVWRYLEPDQVHNYPGIARLLTQKGRLNTLQYGRIIAHGGIRQLTGHSSLLSNKPLRNRLNLLFKPSHVKIEVRIGAVSLMTGEYVIFRCLPANQSTPDKQFFYGIPPSDDSTIDWIPLVSDPTKTPDQIGAEAGEIFKRAVIASTAMPIIWSPIDVGSESQNGSGTLKNMVDGGVRTVSPLADVLRADPNPELVVIINCSCECVVPKEKRTGIIGVALRSLVEISINEVMRNDIDSFERISGILEQVKERGLSPGALKHNDGLPYKYYSSVIIQPNLVDCETIRGVSSNNGNKVDPVGDSLDFGHPAIKSNMDVGNWYGKKGFDDFKRKYYL